MIIWKPFRGGSYSHVAHMGVGFGYPRRHRITEEELHMHVRLGNIPPVPPIAMERFLAELNDCPNP